MKHDPPVLHFAAAHMRIHLREDPDIGPLLNDLTDQELDDSAREFIRTDRGVADAWHGWASGIARKAIEKAKVSQRAKRLDALINQLKLDSDWKRETCTNENCRWALIELRDDGTSWLSSYATAEQAAQGAATGVSMPNEGLFPWWIYDLDEDQRHHIDIEVEVNSPTLKVKARIPNRPRPPITTDLSS